MPCPNCNGGNLVERSSFKTVAEPAEGAAPITVTVDLMACERCATNFPSIRGRKKYALVPPDKLSSLMADLEEARNLNLQMSGSLELLERRSQGLAAEIEEFKVRSEISFMEGRIGALESENKGLQARRAKLKEAVQLMASGIGSSARPNADETLQARESFQ